MSEIPLIDIRPDHWEIVSGILKKHVPDREVWAFGSRAKWTAKAHSDLDLAVIGNKPLGISLSAALADDFSESDLPYRVDVVDWATTSESFRKIIEKDKVLVRQATSQGMSSEAKPLLLPLFASSVTANWSWERLDAIADVYDCPHSTPKLVDDITAPFVVRSQDVRSGMLLLNNAAHVSTETYAERIKRVEPRFGDLVYSREGTYFGIAAEVPKGINVCLGQRMVLIRPDSARIDHNFLRYWLNSPQVFAHIHGFRDGTVAERLNLPVIRGLAVAFPSLPEQQAIAELLSALDNRITLLRETNSTLESIAQALFKSWFVDFDPVSAKMEGREPEGMDAETAALFPDSFEESELGLMPRGWRVGSIGDFVECRGGGTPDTKNTDFWEPAEYSWTTPKDLSGLNSPVLLNTERKLSAAGIKKISSGLLPVGSLLMSSRAPVGYLAIAQIPLAINQGYIAMPPGGALPPLYLLFWCQLNMETIKNYSNGSTFMEISKKAFRPLLAVIPISQIIDEFIKVAKPLFDRLTENERQAQTLSQLRDTLLPRLISGQLKSHVAGALK